MRTSAIIAAVPAAVAVASCGSNAVITEMPSFDGVGLSGLYAGLVDGRIVAAGGANFPDKPLIEGGKKSFHAEVWMLADDGFAHAAELPQPSAYGAYATIGDRLYIAGGSNFNGLLASFVEIAADGNSLSVRELDPMPSPVEQGVAAVDGNRLLVLGGMNDDAPSLDIYAYDFSSGSWSLAGKLPQPMIQPVAMARDGALYVFGGYDPSAGALDYGYVLRDGEWKKIEGLEESTFVGSGCVARDGCLIATGGVDMKIFNDSFRLPGEEIRAYQSHEPEWYRFRGAALSFDPETERWTTIAESSHLARAGAAVVAYDDGIYNLGGELKPGVRCPEVWKLKLKE